MFLSNAKKKLLLFALSATLVFGSAMSAFAADAIPDSAVDPSVILGAGLDSIKDDILNYIGIALPIGLAIMGAFFGIKKVISFFRSIAK